MLEQNQNGSLQCSLYAILLVMKSCYHL